MIEAATLQTYQYGMLNIRCQWPLPLKPLSAPDATTSTFTVLKASESSLSPSAIDWIASSADAFIQIGYAEHHYVLRFTGITDFVVNTTTQVISCIPFATTQDTIHDLTHLLLDQVLPRVLARSGLMALHASAVVIAGQAIFFIGSSGQGKSTIAAQFAKLGYPIVSDDALLLQRFEDGYQAMSVYSGLRLWPDSAQQVMNAKRADSAKQRIIISASKMDWIRVTAGYILEPEATHISIESISAREAMLQVYESLFRLDYVDRAHLSAEFEATADFATRIPIKRLCYPHDYRKLPDVIAHIRADIASLKS